LARSEAGGWAVVVGVVAAPAALVPASVEDEEEPPQPAISATAKREPARPAFAGGRARLPPGLTPSSSQPCCLCFECRFRFFAKAAAQGAASGTCFVRVSPFWPLKRTSELCGVFTKRFFPWRFLVWPQTSEFSTR